MEDESEDNKQVLSLSFKGNLEKITFEMYLGLFLAINGFYQTMGEKRLLVDYSFELPVPRQEIYDAINKYGISSHKIQELNHEVDAEFPKERFSKNIPFNQIYTFLINEHLEDLVYR